MAECDIRINGRTSIRQRLSRAEVIDSENRRTRLIYMRSEPQDTSKVVQVQYERMSIIDMGVEWRWRVGAVRVDRDSQAWW